MSRQYIIGIDEVGRGPLAGPVMVCALALPERLRFRSCGALPPLKDSKKLSAKQREEWSSWIKNNLDIYYSVARVYPRGIERLNISQAANLAATRACARLCRQLTKNKQNPRKVLLDGGLHIREKSLVAGGYSLIPKTVVRADQKFNSVKLASIVAKVSRDEFMKKLDKKFPEYGFAVHKGYGTRAHIAALQKYGPCPAHRVSFIGNFV